ncbi:PAS domain-containing sensor histidine kinase [Mucilaginibacter gotjawali]|uniref:histidine kinase n=1 Tax=Mucilaginibacter gotjawali TaxID=1550579 RepID=A0A839SDI3_9SPHI|nr:PAS domain-containing sensor histidine kinase [Mucilaginibacter gotjawali]MBB3054719.1 PAS domain S-box-containing protein [Mucilaginibacter gotjawali]
MSPVNTIRPLLQQSVNEKLLHLLVASVKDYAIFMLDPAGYILTWNLGAQNIKGYSEDEIIGKHMSVFYTPADIAKNEPKKNLEAAVLNGSHENEGWRVRKDGSLFWASVVFTPLYDDHKLLLGFAKVTRDITEKKKAEDKKIELNIELERRVKENTKRIIANELRFRKLIENSQDGITLFDKDLKLIYRSLSTGKISGWSASERKSYKLIDLIHPDDQCRVAIFFKEIIAKPGVPLITSYRAQHKSGHYIWVESLFTNMLDDENINAIVCNFRDVTERKKAEEDLKQKTAQIENILESITDGFIAIDQNFCYTYANKRIGEMLGVLPDSLIGKNVWDLFPDAVGSDTYNAFQKAMAEQVYYCHEDYYAPLNLWQENHIYPSGQGLSVFIRDISERKRAELALQHLHDNLEKKVVERTLQLESVNKELESFSYSVSHDLRTPLRAVNGYAAMLMEDFGPALGPEGNRIINTIRANAMMMSKLIDELLAFSRLGRKELAVSQTDMKAVAESCLAEHFANGQGKYKVTVRNLPPCMADTNMIKQVWMNLLGNAIKYSAKKTAPEIEVGFIPGEKGPIYYVEDNGVGFEMKYSDKLFGVFQRLHRSDEFEGTGVGLALAKRIIEKHNGEIWAEAELEKGAIFYFRLPSNT